MYRDLIVAFISRFETLNGIILKKKLINILLNKDLSLFSDEKSSIFAILKGENNEISILIKNSFNSFVQRHKGINLRKDEIITKIMSLPYNSTLAEICEFISNLNII